ncbi:MAG: prolipoprotein diacylglyceryl transferase [Thermoanaerobaculia bacterium]
MFVHRIDPVIAEVGGVYLWWYGLSYALGFLELHVWFRLQRRRLAMTMREVYDISVLVPLCVLAGGRLVEVFFYEWPYYRVHPGWIPALWIGGMSTHGLLAGAAAGTAIFCAIHKRSFILIADELVIPGAFLMGIGRIGNFIDGQIVGSMTTMPWGVKFPDADGFRHPVVLYDGIKNLLIIPLLIAIRSRRPRSGIVFANFLLWYAFLRIFVDVFREYPTRLFGLATGQSLNIAMAAAGLVLLVWFGTRPPMSDQQPRSYQTAGSEWLRVAAFAAIVLFCLTIPSDWTQDVPERYGKRHPGLHHSALYPPVVMTVMPIILRVGTWRHPPRDALESLRTQRPRT